VYEIELRDLKRRGFHQKNGSLKYLYTKINPIYALRMNFKSHEGKQGPMARDKEVIPLPPTYAINVGGVIILYI
jgi:hypothetical protein